MADYKPGEMDISEQKQMYDAFWTFSIRIVVLVVIVLVLMAAYLT